MGVDENERDESTPASSIVSFNLIECSAEKGLAFFMNVLLVIIYVFIGNRGPPTPINFEKT